MPRPNNHLSKSFKEKAAAFSANAPGAMLQPTEFVLYLLENHREAGLACPITRTVFEQKIGARTHYFAEVCSDNVRRLPRQLAVALANLTGTNPFFWQKESYTPEDAKNIAMDMNKALPQKKPKGTAPHGIRKQERPDYTEKVVRMLYEGSQEKLTPPELVQYLLDTHQDNGLYCPISRQELSSALGYSDHYFTDIFAKYTAGSTLPSKLVNALANMSKTERNFWQCTDYSLGDATDITLGIDRIPNTTITDPRNQGKQVNPEPDSIPL